MSAPWNPGRPVAVRYGRFDTPRWVYTGNVIADGTEELAILLRPGNPTVESHAADGRDVRDLSLAERTRAELRAQTESNWYGEAAVLVFPAGAPWSVWIFYNADGSVHRAKVNYEKPYVRWSDASGNAFVDTADRELDLVTYPDGTWHFKDEAEFEHIIGRPGYCTPELAAEVREHAEQSLARFTDGTLVRGTYENTGPGSWPTPVLPVSWRDRHTHWP
ncbi:DUF402 domain-containing protein [Phytomonospora endophytica]|uniref:Protein associated with RNAse G/E n=1 Tax=Phytomonospora endophytica TaxID=714109 RepID=A0A841FDL2_9ACTN|nr:DUF402 domain-containing protein [Phytomonospora endophytica]MBB6033545.1 protein associated with RNAse G/E [Phytomonospora endophytica]GIG64937.1 hypothetical protein Pen01_12320 [Phytomonospora endophytica]